MTGLLLLFYNIAFPLFVLLALPGALLKIHRRRGWSPALWGKLARYKTPTRPELQHGLYIHAVSVGEILIAAKFIAEWRKKHADCPIVVAVGTSTAYAIAAEKISHYSQNLKIELIYAPLDLPGFAKKCLLRFLPRAVVLIEAEVWPNFSHAAKKLGIPQIMVNARLSLKSENRFRALGRLSSAYFSGVDKFAVQDELDISRFVRIGVPREKIDCTGSIKFDPENALHPKARHDFAETLAAFGAARPVVLGVSTHSGEEVLIANATRIAHSRALPVLVPRHAERRDEVVKALEAAGHLPILRSQGKVSEEKSLDPRACYIVDTTGELRDWTAHASLAVIGKSFLWYGGQNPVEAILANVPVICGPNMENFQALVDKLDESSGITHASVDNLPRVLRQLFADEQARLLQTKTASSTIDTYLGSTNRCAEIVESFFNR